MGKAPTPPPTWLSPDNVENNDVATILAEPVKQTKAEAEELGSKFAKDRLILPLIRIERTKLLYKWGVNTTTWRALYSAFGDEGKDWINRQVRLTKTIEKFGRRKVTVIYGESHGEGKIGEFM